MINFLLVLVCLVVGFADTFRDHLGIALCVASVFAVCTLHPSRVFQEVSTEGASHHIVELLLYEFVALLFVNFFLFLSHGSLPVEANIKRSASNCLLLEGHGQVNPPRWLELKP